MSSPRPNLFVIGAMKAGSTYLRRLLKAHPSIFFCSPGEPSYFVEQTQLRQLWPAMWRERYWESEERYLRLFGNAGQATVVGEASTAYSKRPDVSGVPQRIERFSPGARYIYIMRDPIGRSISHYWHMVIHHREKRRMLDAVTCDPSFVAYSYYAMQLKAYLDAVGRDRVLVLTLENLVRNPQPELRRLYCWLGVDPDYVPVDLAQAENATPAVVYQARSFDWLHRARQSRLAAQLSPGVPPGLKSFLARHASVEVIRRSVSIDETVNYLRPIQQVQTLELCDLLQRDFPEWTTLWGAGSAI